MKKTIILLSCALLTGNLAIGFPNFDFTSGNSEFMILQQNQFEKEAIEDYNRYRRSQENTYEEELDAQPAPPQKNKTKFNLQNQDLNLPSKQQLHEINSKKNFYQQDGKIIIKSED